MVGQIVVGLVALLHVGFFVLESVLWTKPTGMRIFGLSAEDAEFRDEMREFFTTKIPQEIRDAVVFGTKGEEPTVEAMLAGVYAPDDYYAAEEAQA